MVLVVEVLPPALARLASSAPVPADGHLRVPQGAGSAVRAVRIVRALTDAIIPADFASCAGEEETLP